MTLNELEAIFRPFGQIITSRILSDNITGMLLGPYGWAETRGKRATQSQALIFFIHAKHNQFVKDPKRNVNKKLISKENLTNRIFYLKRRT